LNGKNDRVETATDSVADARGPIQIAATRIFIPIRCKYLDGAAARDAAIIFVLARSRESDCFLTAHSCFLVVFIAAPGIDRPMQFQKAHVSIVRSIRHVSLVRDWHRARGTRDLPEFSDFVPNERAGDSADLSISDIVREDGKLSFVCRQAGPRVEQVHDARMASRR
jgi:hypothetical protein